MTDGLLKEDLDRFFTELNEMQRCSLSDLEEENPYDEGYNRALRDVVEFLVGMTSEYLDANRKDLTDCGGED